MVVRCDEWPPASGGTASEVGQHHRGSSPPHSRLRLIAGLGNPGETYAETRHNIGFRVIDHIAESCRCFWEYSSADLVCGRGRLGDVTVLLAKPLAFMNNSGPPLLRLTHAYGIHCREMVVIYDDIDLAYGRVKIQEKGGSGGHRGLGSIIAAFETQKFIRLRLGIGRPASKADVVDYVLSNFRPEEANRLDAFLGIAKDAVETILNQGTMTGMNVFNKRGVNAV
ncbi:MAG: aminoacyl-tRNA hydrolase [Desulfosarcinaceae bacterium]|nr:aminoacyl-tRNA hydrolase [Desulfosarcinaceae bacterium]